MTRRLLHVAALGWAVAMATMPAALAVADGRLEAKAAHGGVGHVEATGSDTCPPGHDAGCAVCTLLRLGTTPPAASPALSCRPSSRSALPRTWMRIAPMPAEAAARPRAPPAS